MDSLGVLLAVPMTLIVKGVFLDASPSWSKLSYRISVDIPKQLTDEPEN